MATNPIVTALTGLIDTLGAEQVPDAVVLRGSLPSETSGTVSPDAVIAPSSLSVLARAFRLLERTDPTEYGRFRVPLLALPTVNAHLQRQGLGPLSRFAEASSSYPALAEGSVTVVRAPQLSTTDFRPEAVARDLSENNLMPPSPQEMQSPPSVPESQIGTGDIVSGEHQTWAGQINLFLHDIGVSAGITAPDLLVHGLARASSMPKAVREYLGRILEYRGALEGLPDDPNVLTVLLSARQRDTKQELNALPRPVAIARIPFNLQGTGAPIAQIQRPDGLRVHADPAHYDPLREGVTGTTPSYWMDPLVGRKNVLMVDTSDSEGRKLAEGILGNRDILDRALPLTSMAMIGRWTTWLEGQVRKAPGLDRLIVLLRTPALTREEAAEALEIVDYVFGRDHNRFDPPANLDSAVSCVRGALLRISAEIDLSAVRNISAADAEGVHHGVVPRVHVTARVPAVHAVGHRTAVLARSVGV